MDWAIVPCGADKAAGTVPVEELYTSSTFRMALAAALNITDREHVLVLSAKHGLLTLGTLVEAYDVKMGDPDSIAAVNVTAQAAALGIGWGDDVWALLPQAYFARLDEALRDLDVWAAPVYEATGGIGDQRRVANLVAA